MSEREWRFDLGDMLRFAEKVRTYSAGIDRGTFEQDELKYDAILPKLSCVFGDLLHRCPPCRAPPQASLFD